MPKLPKGFGRRKSTANAIEDVQELPVAQPSFRVFERSDGGGKSFDGGAKLAKYSPKTSTPQKSHDDNIFADLKFNRGSGTSNTNTASTTDNSSRLSAASTAPSSTDLPGQSDWRSPHDKPYSDIPVPGVPRTTSGFSLKAGGRTFSFGRSKPSTPSPTKLYDDPPPPLPPKDSDENLQRPRAVTASSYASTATPPKLEDKDLGLSLGGDFMEMFSGFAKRKSTLMNMDSANSSQSMDPSPQGPTVPARSYAGNRVNQPPPLDINRSKDVSPSPLSLGSQNSHDGLMTNSSPLNPPPVPRHGSPQVLTNAISGTPTTRVQRPGASAETGLKRNSAVANRRKSTVDYSDAQDEEATLLKASLNAVRHLTSSPVDIRARDSWLGPLSSMGNGQSKEAKSAEVTRKPVSTDANLEIPKLENRPSQESLFQDGQITAAVQLAQQYEERPNSPPKHLISKHKVMTPAQFERYRQEQERIKNAYHIKDEDEEEEEDAYEDDEDEAEKQRQIAKQRRKQEAHMSVYRQQMMKVTGETPSPTPAARLSTMTGRSTLNIPVNTSSPLDEDEGDEEIPLAILAAHGFPNKNRPPGQLPRVSSNPNLRPPTMMGAYLPPQSATPDPIASAHGSGLPVFARKLPEDPYFGAGLVNPMNRESLALGTGGAGSTYGGSTRGAPPGGLVGVIATEERSRAMRRGSPNANGEYGPPSNGLNGMGMPQNMPMQPMGRSMTMPAGMGPMGPMGPMITPAEQAQWEMTRQMQDFMHVQMQFMHNMLASNQGRPQSQGGLQPPMPQLQPQGQRPDLSQQRVMSMVDLNAAPPWQQPIQRNTMYVPSIQGGGYAPSIAPSERSNVGLPGRYRPVSHYPAAENKSRTATMSGAIQDWSNTKQAPATVKVVQKSGNASDEDDEAAWEAMKQKREKKKSMWRSKKDDGSAAMKDLWNYATNAN